MFQFPISLIFNVIFTACTSDKDADTSSSEDTSVEDTNVPGADLDGTWVGPCYESTQVVINYDNLALTGTYTEYADDA